MICPKCGTDNKPKFKFCVKCGSNLEDPGEVNIEQVDMGGYRSEEDYASDKNSFKIGSGTFTISDRAPVASNGMFTADELNDTDEEFDFSSYDEPYIPKLDADRLTVPTGNPDMLQHGQPHFNPQGNTQPNNVMQGGYPQQTVMPQGAPGQMMSPQQPNGAMNSMMNGNSQNGMPGQPVQQGQPMNGMGMNPYMNQMYGGQPVYGTQQMMAPPQIVGYDQNGMPIYSQPQPVMYAPPQIVGYDQNGMPVYGQPQPMMYAPPQIAGYDQNGMPIYSQSQPMMYGQPQPVMNENGEYQSAPYPGAVQPSMPTYPGMPAMNMNAAPVMPGQPVNGMYGAPVQPHQQTAAPQRQSGGQVKVSNEFWNSFFSGSGKNQQADSESEDQDDFFSKPRHERSYDMGGVSAEGLDMSRLKKHERKKNTYMNDTPEVNADDLQPNTADELNKRFMRGTAVVNADELEAKKQEKTQDIMGVTDDVSAKELEAYEHKKSRVTMKKAGEANAEDLEVYEREHREAIMEQADHAVEALPKKKAAPVDEIDAIELPEYMQAKKTVHDDTPEIPGLPEI